MTAESEADLVQLKLDNLDVVCEIVGRLEGEIAQLKSWIKSQKCRSSIVSISNRICQLSSSSYNYTDNDRASQSNGDDDGEESGEKSQVYDQAKNKTGFVHITPEAEVLIVGDIVKEEYDPLDISPGGGGGGDSNFIDESIDEQDQDQSGTVEFMDDLQFQNEFDQSVNNEETEPIPSSKSFLSGNQIRKLTARHRFPCTICGKMYTRSHDMKRHMNIHDSDLKYECQFCGLKFLTHNRKDHHIRREHKDELVSNLPYKCDFQNCQHANVTMIALMKHKEEHNGLQCPKCESTKVFYKRSNLKKHLEVIHFVCNSKQCNSREFPSRKSLNFHRRISHNINSSNII